MEMAARSEAVIVIGDRRRLQRERHKCSVIVWEYFYDV